MARQPPEGETLLIIERFYYITKAMTKQAEQGIRPGLVPLVKVLIIGKRKPKRREAEWDTERKYIKQVW